MKKVLLLTTLFFCLLAINSCKDDDDSETVVTTPLTLSSIAVGDVSLTATSVVDVPVQPTITAEFSNTVDTTGIASNIKLVKATDTATSLALTFTVSAKIVAIKPVTKLKNGVAYKLSIGSGLKSTKKEKYAGKSFTFTTVDEIMRMTSLVSGSVNLMSAPINAPIDTTIVATFPDDINASTIDTNSIKLIRAYDSTKVKLKFVVSGAVVTIKPQSKLTSGVPYSLVFTNAIKTVEAKSVTATTKSFTTTGSFVPDGLVAYWDFEGDAKDKKGSLNANAEIDMTYTASYGTKAGKAATFNGSTSIIEIPNAASLINTTDITMSFWIYIDSAKWGHFPMGINGSKGFFWEIDGGMSGINVWTSYKYNDAGETETDQFAFNGGGSTKDNGGWQGTTYAYKLENKTIRQFLSNNWMQVVYTFNSSTKLTTMYINGSKVAQMDYNLWGGYNLTNNKGLKYSGEDGGDALALGFPCARNSSYALNSWANYSNVDNSHFQGQMDNLRIFHKALTEKEISLLYTAEK